MTDAIANTLLEYIGTELLDDVDDVAVDDKLLADGMVDSLGMLRLMAFIEENFGIAVPPEDVGIQNFSTVERVVAYLTARGAGESA